jgi:hypothetical protein
LIGTHKPRSTNWLCVAPYRDPWDGDSIPAMDHDFLFKELIKTFFIEFVEMLLPDLAKYLDRNQIEFLDKEIFTDIKSGNRHQVDLLVKARFKNLGQVYFLIHIETQAKAQQRFERRMFLYCARLDERYDLPVFPIAVFSYDRPLRKEANHYTVEFPGFKVLDFQYRAIQLNRLNWRDYIRNPNPVASALMSKMKIAPKDRPKVKLECLRMLATLRIDTARKTLISVFIDSYLRLTIEETMVYNRQLAAIEPKERKVVMQLTNEWIEKGKAVGLLEGRKMGRQEGRQKGRQEGRRDMVKQQLRSRWPISQKMAGQINALSDTQLAHFGEAIFGFHTIADAQHWLAKNL